MFFTVVSHFFGAPDYVLKEKLKALKNEFNVWARQEFEKKVKRKEKIANALLVWDLKAEQGDITKADCVKRDGLLFESMQLEQK